MDTLANTVALVTGGGSGIGRAACQLFADAGAAVAVVDLRAEAAQAVADEITAGGGHAIALAADVSDEAATAQAVAEAYETLGGLHTVFANAGINGTRADRRADSGRMARHNRHQLDQHVPDRQARDSTSARWRRRLG